MLTFGNLSKSQLYIFISSLFLLEVQILKLGVASLFTFLVSYLRTSAYVLKLSRLDHGEYSREFPGYEYMAVEVSTV